MARREYLVRQTLVRFWPKEGSSRGLDRAFAQALLAAGARAAITGRTAPEVHETAAQLSSAANQVLAIPADTTDPQGVPQVVTTNRGLRAPSAPTRRRRCRCALWPLSHCGG